MMLLVAISHLPFRVLYAFSDLLYYPLYHVVRYRRRIVRSNLTTVFPEKSEAEIRSIEKKFYHFFVDIVFECIKMVSITPDEMKRRMRFEGMDYVNGLLGQGKSISLYLGHYGNWEWVSSMGLRIGGDVVTAQVYRQLSNGQTHETLARAFWPCFCGNEKYCPFYQQDCVGKTAKHHRIYRRPVTEEKGCEVLCRLPFPQSARPDRNRAHHEALWS